jgi:hypothetical protein
MQSICPSLNCWRICWRKGSVRRLANCFFRNPEWNNPPPLGRGFSSASATLRPPQTLDQGAIPPSHNIFLFLNSQPSPFVPAPIARCLGAWDSLQQGNGGNEDFCLAPIAGVAFGVMPVRFSEPFHRGLRLDRELGTRRADSGRLGV